MKYWARNLLATTALVLLLAVPVRTAWAVPIPGILIIEVSVTDSDLDVPIFTGVRVRIYNENVGFDLVGISADDDEGIFLATGLEPGYYIVEATPPFGEPGVVVVLVEAGEVEDINIPISVSGTYDQEGDGLSGWLENSVMESVADQVDTDEDGMPDSYEMLFRLGAADEASGERDADRDGLTNLQEFLLRTNPRVINAIPGPFGKVIPSGLVFAVSSSQTTFPIATATIHVTGVSDLVTDATGAAGFGVLANGTYEYVVSHPDFRTKTRSVSVSGGLKSELVTLNPNDPFITDSDGDGLKDEDETNTYGTDPNDADTDKDGFPDDVEISFGTNPLVFDGIPADVNMDGALNALDIQLTINSALGLITAYRLDINQDGPVNALDIQMAINAALGLG